MTKAPVSRKGGISLLPDEATREFEFSLQRVIDFRYSGEESGIGCIFRSSPGLKMGTQMLGLLDFIHRLHRQSLIISLLPFLKEILRSVEEGEKVLEPSEDVMDAFNRAMTGLFKELPRWSQIAVSDASENNRQEMDSMWFVSLVSFSLYAYLEAYTKDLIDLLESAPAVAQRVGEYLRNLEEKKTRSCRRRAKGPKGLKSMGMKGRLDTLSSALGLEKTIIEIIDVHELDWAKKAFNRFMDIRGKLAHNSPRLAPSGYGESEFEKDVADMLIEMKPSYTPSMLQGLEHMTEAYRLMFTSLTENTVFFSKLNTMVVMAVTYPALFDCALAARQRDGDYSTVQE